MLLFLMCQLYSPANQNAQGQPSYLPLKAHNYSSIIPLDDILDNIHKFHRNNRNESHKIL